MHELNLATWPRREQFYFFKDYDLPFFNVCADLDVSELRNHLKRQGGSFFLASLFLSMRAANRVEPFRYRMRGEKVVVHEVVHGGSTVLRADDTFGFCYFNFQPDFGDFERSAQAVLTRFRSGAPRLNPEDNRDDLIHYSVLPWVSFTSFSHARRFKTGDTVPKMVFGKFYERDRRWLMPVSVEVHHGLMDGLHVGRFFEAFQADLADPAACLAGA